MLFLGGGIIPEKDIPKLREAGIAQIFGPGTPLEEIIKYIKTNLGKRTYDNKD